MGASPPLKFFCKLDLAEEDPWIMVLVIETILELSDALDRPVDFIILTEHHKGGAGLSELWVEELCVNHLYGFVFVLVVSVKKIRHRGTLAVVFIRETED